MADIWQPIGGLSIRNLEEKCCLFSFYYEIDIDKIVDGGPWMFNNHLLLIHLIKEGEKAMQVPLFFVNF